jgi:hypothetical protein
MHYYTLILCTHYTCTLTIRTSSAALLIGRFKEREENVQLDVFACFTELLRVTVTAKERKGKSPAKELLEDKVR